MLRLEQKNETREARGLKPLPLPQQWVERPYLTPAEHGIFNDYIQFAAFCGGEVDPTKALSWFDMQGVASEDRGWLGSIYAQLSPVLRETSDM